MRYLPVVQSLLKDSPTKILDVGCGFRGIGPYIAQNYVGCDPLLNPNTPPFGKPHSQMHPLAASDTQLPFPDNCFDMVISMDMLEHIPPQLRTTVIQELYRVARHKVILGFPEGNHTIKWEIRTAKWYQLTGHEVPDWLEEHFQYGLPQHKDITSFLNAQGIPYHAQANVNCAIHFVINMIECSFLEPHMTTISQILMQSEWEKKEHSWKANLIRAQRKIVFQLLKYVNFGKTVRQIYYLSKPAAQHT